MTELVWNANGQGEFDFDYLLNLTSQVFVDVVSRALCDEFRGTLKSIKVEDTGDFVRVYIIQGAILSVYNYFKNDKSYEFIPLSISDLDWALGAMRNGER